MAGSSPLPVPIAFSLADGRADWAEIALVVGVGFVAAYVVAEVAARFVRWSFRSVVGGDEAGLLGAGARRPIFVARIVTFLLVWAALTVPLLRGIGVGLGLGLADNALRYQLVTSSVRILAVVLIAWLVLRVARLGTDRLAHEISTGEGLDVLERSKRAQTLARLIHNVLRVLVTSIALLMVLRELGVDILPMLTGAGIVGVALGFGAQWLVRDVIAGFYLILDNQVRVGDVAAINGVGGVVEAINLRTIVLRDLEGTVHVFQNGAINTLSNRSKDFSYYVIDLNVAYGHDPDRLSALVRKAGAELQQDPRFGPSILEPVEIFGVDAFLDTKITIKLRIKTLPLKQWEVGRELRRRILDAFDREGISLLTPNAVMMQR